MSLFARPEYVSEATLFIEQLKQAKPTLEAEQRQGRALLWDTPLNASEQKAFKAAKVAQKPYVYFNPSVK
jgi:hypothetical protein